MLALVGKDAISAEEAIAANTELAEAGIKGAQLINEATFTELTEKAGRVDTAEQAATEAQETITATTEALTAAGVDSVSALVAERDAYKVKADKYDLKPGASHSAAVLPAGTSDVEKGEPDAHQEAIDSLPHNKALSGHPLFG
ncbi:hypothetical protein ACFQT0_19525 [Hymenobacter humi]|uniref:Uncharacterized protein n=1 Tax=Hymenobacter humi TaxID=1411620 RepID=A0ABW2U7Q1_9BACT